MPIVNPFIFYVIDLFEKLNLCLMITFAVSVFVLLYSWVTEAQNYYSGSLLFDDEKVYRKRIRKNRLLKIQVKRAQKIFMIVSVVCLIAFVLIPNKNTSYKMLVANYVTVERVDVAADKADEYFNKIVDAIEKRGEQRQ